MAKSYNQVINTPHALEQCKRLMDKVFKESTVENGEIYHFFLNPFQAPKTHQQLKTIRKLCNDLSANKENHWAGYSSDWWYRHYKLHAYVPLLKMGALDKNDSELIDLIESASTMIKASKGASLFAYDLDKIIWTYNKYLKDMSEKHNRPIIEIMDRVKNSFIRHSKAKDMGHHGDYRVQDFIADNPAFSYSSASKEHLIIVIDYILKDAAKKGIILTIEKQDGDK